MTTQQRLSSAPSRRRALRPLARRRSPSVLAVGALSVCMLAGCGKSGPPTKAEYIAKANAVCRSEKQSLDTIALSSGSFQSGIDQANQARAEAGAKLARIRKPADSRVVSEWLSVRASALALGQKFSLHKPSKALNRAYFLANAKAERIARSYGLTSCVGFSAS